MLSSALPRAGRASHLVLVRTNSQEGWKLEGGMKSVTEVSRPNGASEWIAGRASEGLQISDTGIVREGTKWGCVCAGVSTFNWNCFNYSRRNAWNPNLSRGLTWFSFQNVLHSEKHEATENIFLSTYITFTCTSQNATISFDKISLFFSTLTFNTLDPKGGAGSLTLLRSFPHG